MSKITKKPPSALPIYMAAAVWIVLALFLPMHRLVNILIAAVLSLAAWFAGKKVLFPDKVEEIEVPDGTGDPELDKKLAAAREQLAQIRACNEKLPGEEISQRLDRIEQTGLSILDVVTRQPEKQSQIRRFLNYYLPTTLKLLDNYIYLEGSGAENAQTIQTSVENSLEMIASAFESLHDQLLRSNAIDITSEIQAMETIFASDGLARK